MLWSLLKDFTVDFSIFFPQFMNFFDAIRKGMGRHLNFCGTFKQIESDCVLQNGKVEISLLDQTIFTV